MTGFKHTFSRLLLLFIFLTGPGRLSAQWELIERLAAQSLDTSEYVSYLFSDALEYNLMIAASKGYSSEIERLINLGANVNHETADGATPLVFAVANRKTEAVTTILAYDPVIDKVTVSNETPLMIAAKSQSFEIAEKLIRAGADVNFTDGYGATSLHYAAIYGYPDIADLLIYYDAKPDEKTTDGSTPLHGAIWAGNITIADILLQNGASVDIKDNSGMTPFLLASYFGDTVAMELLSQKGADIYALNNNGYNALSMAIMSEQSGAAEYLLGKGKNWTAPDIRATDPYSIAAKYGRKDMISLLEAKNVPGKVKYGIDQISLTLSSRFSFHDNYTGLTIAFKEPYLNIGFLGGFDTKLWRTRILIKESEGSYYQFWDKSSLAYAGVFKDFILKEYPKGTSVVLSASLRGGYAFGNRFEGSYRGPESQFRIIPAVSFQWNISNIFLHAGMEYTRTDFYHTGPVWLRLGIGYTSFFDNVRIRIKPPKWY